MATQGQARLISREGRSNVVSAGLPRNRFSDLYHSWLAWSWMRVFAVLIALFLVVNLLFGAAYAEVGGIENLAPGSFSDGFFFSVQTLATIGYGRMSPVSLGAHLLVTAEALCGMAGTALATGLMVAKFARPTARVLWSNVAVIARRDGMPSLMFRVANARANQVVEAQLHVGLLRSELTAEGEAVRRMYDLPLIRQTSAVFTLSWLAVHPITPQSRLYGETLESLRATNSEIFISLTGLDATFGQMIHARHSYAADEILFGRRFVDIFDPRPGGGIAVDYTRFHDTLEQG